MQPNKSAASLALMTCGTYPGRMDAFFRFFERFAQPFERAYQGPPPPGGIGFILHYAKQVRGAFIAMLVLGGLTAWIEAALFIFVGWLVDMMSSSGPQAFFTENYRILLAMAFVVVIVRSAIASATAILEEQIVVPDFFTLVRWQAHQSVSKQDVSFFDDQLAGRVANKVWQSGQAAGDVMVSLLQIIWFIAMFAITTLLVVFSLDWRLFLPVAMWITIVVLIAWYFVPRIRDKGRQLAESVAVVTGQIVDGYSNIRTVKLYAAENSHNQFIRSAYEGVLADLRLFTRIISGMRISFQCFSSLMLVVITACASWLFTQSVLSAGEVAVVLALCLRLNLLLGRLLGLLNGLFRNFGTVQNSAELISQRPEIVDLPHARTMPNVRGKIEFKDVSFGYTSDRPTIANLSLTIPAGQKVGIVGHSGVGKSTLVNLLLRFYDIDEGEIAVDGHDISSVTQNSLRSQIGIVTQDTALLHQSVKNNIAYGQSGADLDTIKEAATRASAHDFIEELRDNKGRAGYDTFVGERGVKLSGGQRQRIAIARVFLKNAPVLLLDEATSALDSEVEAAIQENLEALMKGKTVVAIAHRLSTIAHLDRLIVMENGKIVEDGDHASLLAMGGQYSRLWEHQSGGFLSTHQPDSA